MRRTAAISLVLMLLTAACGDEDDQADDNASQPTSSVTAPLPTVGAPGGPTNVYGQAGAAHLSALVADDLPRVYVPNGGSGDVTVIDPVTFKVLRTVKTGELPQHVVPSHDLRTLWVNNNVGNTLTPIDAETGEFGASRRVDAPYNLYFTPDGAFMIVVAERDQRLDFRDPVTLEVRESVTVPCKGVNHIDFSADGTYLLATCEFAGRMIKVDVASRRVVGELDLGGAGRSQPQDVRLVPDGSKFYVADMLADGVHVIDGVAFEAIAFIPTGIGTHGIYPSRDGRLMYVTNRGSHGGGGRHLPGDVAVVDPTKGDHGEVVTRWPVPGGGSPDMGNVTADGRRFWVSGRYDDEVYCFDTATGELVARIPVGRGPHGLTVWPQPGRYSLGHTGNMR